MMLGICALNSEKVFVQIPKCKNPNLQATFSKWFQYQVPIDEFIKIMFDNFPNTMKKAKPYFFTNNYELANWLHNMSGDRSGNMFIFDNKKTNYLYFDSIEYKEAESQFRIKKSTIFIEE